MSSIIRPVARIKNHHISSTVRQEFNLGAVLQPQKNSGGVGHWLVGGAGCGWSSKIAVAATAQSFDHHLFVRIVIKRNLG